jgi:hypothetical protein
LARQEITDGLNFAYPSDGLASGAGFEIHQRQAQQVIKQLDSKLDVDSARRVRQYVGPKILKHGLKKANDD